MVVYDVCLSACTLIGTYKQSIRVLLLLHVGCVYRNEKVSPCETINTLFLSFDLFHRLVQGKDISCLCTRVYRRRIDGTNTLS